MTLKETAELYAALQAGRTLQRREVRVISGSVDSITETTPWEDVDIKDTDTLNPALEYRVKPKQVRWRAKSHEPYWYIDAKMAVNKDTEYHVTCDDTFWEVGNYFESKSDAEAALKRFKAILDEYKQKYTTEE